MEFEWDFLQEKTNVEKHGIYFKESIETFSDPLGFELDDIQHSKLEIRRYWVGKNSKNRILTTWFTRRGDVIRIIGSAEWRKFKRYYYETTQIK